MSAEEILRFFELNQVLSYLRVAFATCVLFDHFTTLDVEIESIWKRKKWTLVHVLFLINRYLGDIYQIITGMIFPLQFVQRNRLGCILMARLHFFCAPVVLFSMQGILMYRVSSMYNHRKTIIKILLSSFCLEIAAVVVIIISTFIFTGHTEVAPGIQPCTLDHYPYFLFAIWIPTGFFEGLIFILALNVAVSFYRDMGPRFSWLDGMYWNGLTFILFRDSMTYPFIMVVICIVNLYCRIKLPIVDNQITSAIATFIPCILGCRLMLNLQEAYYFPFQRELELGEVPSSIVEFRSYDGTDAEQH